ncbi:MAG: HAD-IA family hydrolase, partial [Pseudomonadota bacterium]
GARKPDPAPVREALRRLGVAPADAVFVGDAAEDRHAARAAGLRVVLMRYGYAKTAADRHGAVVIDDLSGLEAALRPAPKPAPPSFSADVAPHLSAAADRARRAAQAAASKVKTAAARVRRRRARTG